MAGGRWRDGRSVVCGGRGIGGARFGIVGIDLWLLSLYCFMDECYWSGGASVVWSGFIIVLGADESSWLASLWRWILYYSCNIKACS
jgi:hypothetical protein